MPNARFGPWVRLSRRRTSVAVPTNRNSVGRSTMVFYVCGILSFAVGLYLASITQINLLTGSTTNPYLGIGIALAVIGLAIVVVTRRTAKRNLSK
jgi:hypothetical protein